MASDQPTTPYGRRTDRAPGSTQDGRRGRRAMDEFRRYDGEHYYNLPALKSSPWGWLVACYFFIGGLGGAVQVIATVVDLVGRDRDRAVVRAGRYLALLSALVSPVLLILDLHTPSRWYNMLRIYRRTSPMSIGSWVLAAFGAFTALTALGQALDDRFKSTAGRRLARSSSLPAAVLGAGMASYTATLVSSTATPLWSTAAGALPTLFSDTAVATATAAMSLVAQRLGASNESLQRLDQLALLAALVQLVSSRTIERTWQRAQVAARMEQSRRRWLYRVGALGAGAVVPLAIHSAHLVTRRRSTSLASIACVAAPAGGFVERAAIVFAGNESALRPRDYFRITQ